MKKKHLIQPGLCGEKARKRHDAGLWFPSPTPKHPFCRAGPGVERGTFWIFWCAGAEKTSGARKWALGQATEEGVRTLGLGRRETRCGGNACGVGFQELWEC